MAFAWADIFVPPIGDSGNFDSGSYLDLDEWPFSIGDIAARQLAASGTDTIGLDFDISSAPGDKKGFWVWVQWVSQQSGGYTITAVRLIDNNGPTTLWTDSSPGITVPQDTTARMHAIRIPDSAMASDPDLDDLTVEFDIRNDHGGNNQLRFTGIRLSKSPFTTAQEAFLPSTLDGQDFSCYRASDLAVLGAVDTEAIVVWPDASGNGRHLLRTEGTFPSYNSDTVDYVSFSNSSGTRFNTYWGPAVTGNHIHHTLIYPTLTAVTQSPWSHAGGQFHGFATTQKSILGQDFTGGVNNWVMMSGDGSPGAHIRTTDITLNDWQRVTEWVQDAGNEHMWLDDDASPAIDAASGSNDMVSLSVGAREDSTLFFEGRIAEHWWIDGSGITEGDIDDARDEWVAGLAGFDPANLTAMAVSADVQLDWDPSFS